MFDAILRKDIWFIVFGTALVVGGYYLFLKPKPCAAPVAYRIGTLDPQFGVTETEFQDDIEKASDIWSTAAGKPLFKYDPRGGLVINLVYDTRQKTTQEETKLKTNIAQGSQSADAAKQAYLNAKSDYQGAVSKYETELAQFNRDQDAYNQKVSYFNAHGGAPQNEYQALQSQKTSLDTRRATLQTEQVQVNALAKRSNDLADSYNAVVDKVNTTVDKFNNDGLAGTQFEEGVYVSDRSGRHIDIYQFDDKTTFVRVLAHELGHSLGLSHNNDEGSIMNPVNDGSSLSLSTQDLGDMQQLCGIAS
jgi:predicted Zn-dependent protease